MEKIKSRKKIFTIVAVAVAVFLCLNVCYGVTSNAAQNSRSDNGHAKDGGIEFGGQSIGGGGREWSEERGNFRNVVLKMDDNCDYQPNKFKWIGNSTNLFEVGLDKGYIDWYQNKNRPESHDYYYMSELSFGNLHFAYARSISTEWGESNTDTIGLTYDKESGKYSGENSFKLFFKMICKKADGSGEEVVYGGDDFDDTYDDKHNGETLGGLMHRKAEGEPEALDTPIEKIRHITGQEDILEAIHNGSVTFVLYKIQAHH